MKIRESVLDYKTANTTMFARPSLPVEHRAQTVQLILEFPEQRVLRVLVDLRLVLYILRAVRISQRAQTLLVVVVHWPDTRDHHCFRVSTCTNRV